MTDLKLGILLWNQATVLARLARAPPAGRPPRLRPPLGVGPPLRDLRRPVPADLRGLVDARRVAPWRPSGRASGCWSAPTRSATPGSSAKTAATLDHISDGRAILGIGGAWMEPEHEAHGIEFGTGFGQRLDWLDESVGAMRALLDGEHGDVRARRPLRLRRPAPRPAAGPEAAADHDRRLGREEDAADRRQVRRHVERRWARSDFMAHKVEVLQGHCDAVGRDIGEIEFTLGVKLTIRDTEAEADRVWKAAMEHNRTPLSDLEGDTTFWNGTPEQIAERLRAVRRARLPDRDLRAAGAVRRRDVRAIHRRGQAARRARLSRDRPRS